MMSPDQDDSTPMFWLHFCAMGGSEDLAAIFVYVSGSEWGGQTINCC